MTLRRVDASNDIDFSAWFQVLHRSELARDGTEEDGWLPEELRARSIDESAPAYFQLYAEEVNGAFVAAAALEVTRDDNRESSWVMLMVDPLHLRRGHGTSSLRAIEAIALAQGRRHLVVSARETSAQWGAGASRAFAPALGYHLSEENVQRDLAWPRPAGELEEWETRWAPHARDYEILAWRGPMREEFTADFAHLASVMPIEAPHGDRPVEAELWDQERVRHHEGMVEAMGRDYLVSVARERASGRLVGFSELTVSRERPALAYQWSTLVVGRHRGHRLGGLMKVANLRQLERAHYATTRIATFNEVSNRAMIALNEQLGARVNGGFLQWAKKLA